MGNFLSLIAVSPPPQGANIPPNPLIAYGPLFISMFLIMYFLVIRPQKKEQEKREVMLKNLKKGDKIVTAGGVLGTVIGVKENIVVIKSGENGTKLEILKSSVTSVINDK